MMRNALALILEAGGNAEALDSRVELLVSRDLHIENDAVFDKS
jgi:hypothetical protein